MSSITSETIRDVVYDIVRQIPPGKLLTYGAIASLAGYPNHSRLVGRIMRLACDSSLPCHRVVAANGVLSSSFPEQAMLLYEEGVVVSPTNHVSVEKYLWKIDEYLE